MFQFNPPSRTHPARGTTHHRRSLRRGTLQNFPPGSRRVNIRQVDINATALQPHSNWWRAFLSRCSSSSSFSERDSQANVFALQSCGFAPPPNTRNSTSRLKRTCHGFSVVGRDTWCVVLRALLEIPPLVVTRHRRCELLRLELQREQWIVWQCRFRGQIPNPLEFTTKHVRTGE